MRTWTRASVEQPCGGCGARIVAGAPLVAMTHTGRTWRLLRCAACAKEPAPEDLAPLAAVIRDGKVKSADFVPVRSLSKLLPLDYKQRQSGDA